ncbi:MAG: hypothetical protein KKE62_14270 [Proteobacteria bacterium]|nr:hypothetical protein [Pseudomonadota bacterium]MBU1543995.1 hypothetical protein [Pseudomonadota bacterium]MBU2430670.1 hypothetical protein [Pseudomonadota bacterium]MBU2481466.1 hypothetical protein [Pseudomonadota bacterium]
MIKIVSENRLKCLVLLVLLTFCLTGCVELLTDSQIREIKKFSAASNTYSEYPGTVMKAHADLSLYNQLTNASSAVDGENAFGLIEKGIEKQKRLIALGERADNACKILRSYSGILDKLSSDIYTSETQASVEKFGSQLDRSIKEYNQITKSSITLFGGTVAAIVKGTASIYIRNKQHAAIKTAVQEADPVIEEITNSIITFLETYAGPNSLEILQAERDDLQTWYEMAGYKQPLSTSIWVSEKLKIIESILMFVDKSKKAAISLREAHTVLMTKIDKKMDLRDTIEIIETLVDEVEAAKDLKNKIEKQSI